MLQNKYLDNTWIEISESAYAHNLAFFRNRIGDQPEFSVVVKANAYGHGWQSIARLAVKHQADSFCVHSIDEANRLRRAGFSQNILIMGHIPISRLADAVSQQYRIMVCNRETLQELMALNAGSQHLIRIHLKLETGTNRQGILPADLAWFLRKIKTASQILLEGVYTHFANIEDTTTYEYPDYQKHLFEQLTKQVRAAGFSILKRHAACTAAVLLFPETHLEMVRLGIGQYGLWPSRETRVSFQSKATEHKPDILRPVLSWKTRVSQIKWVEAENSVGYGRTYQTTRRTRLAVLPIGYSDGYDRRLSNQSYVLIRGRRAAVRGRICMNLMMVDITDIKGVQLEDEVILIGQSGKESIDVDLFASWCGTINYEVLARLNPEIPRMIVD